MTDVEVIMYGAMWTGVILVLNAVVAYALSRDVR